jgi:aspartokinase
MHYRLGVAGNIFTTQADGEVNVLVIAHGSSVLSISLVVSAADLETSIQAMHGLTVNGGG